MNALASLARHAVTYLVGVFVAWITVYLTLPGEAQAAADAAGALIEPLVVLVGLAAAVLSRLAMPALNKIFRLSAGEGSGGASGGTLLLAVGLGLGTAAVGMLPSCSPAQLAAARAVPVRSCVETDYGTVCYSSKSGIALTVDAHSQK